jgi:hypothetical protein
MGYELSLVHLSNLEAQSPLLLKFGNIKREGILFNLDLKELGGKEWELRNLNLMGIIRKISL